jgi:cytochrome c biogenesis protein ResB
MITVGGKNVMTHGVMGGDNPQAELFTVENDSMTSIGFLRAGQSFEIGRGSLSLGSVKRFTGMQVYNRPQEPILVFGSVLMFLGLVWHFYFRHRDRRKEAGESEGNA